MLKMAHQYLFAIWVFFMSHNLWASQEAYPVGITDGVTTQAASLFWISLFWKLMFKNYVKTVFIKMERVFSGWLFQKHNWIRMR
jgi:hypothetical protein